MAQLLDTLRAQNGRLPDGLVKPLLDFFLVAREVAGGDLELHIILMVIAVRTIEHPEFAQMPVEQRDAGDHVFPSLGVNTRSIADSTGVPRETVRRKVADLYRKGWLVRRGLSLHYTAKAYRESVVVRTAMERLAVSYYEILRKEVLQLPLEQRPA